MSSKKCSICGFVSNAQAPDCPQCHMRPGLRSAMKFIRSLPAWVLVTASLVSVLVGAVGVSAARNGLLDMQKRTGRAFTELDKRVVEFQPVTVRRSYKSREMDAMADVSDKDCVMSGNLMAIPAIAKGAAAQRLAARCELHRQKETSPAAWKAKLDQIDRDEAGQ